MGILTPAQVFRKFVTDGASESGAHDPVKSEIVQLLERIEQSSAAGIVVRQTKAALDAVTPGDENAGGWVLNDSTASNNGYYYRSAGAWVKGRGFPDTAAVLINVAGTGNAITANTEAGVNPADIELLILPDPPGTNGPGGVTIALNGDPAEAIKNSSGGEPAPGDIITGVGTLFFRFGTEWRQLFSSATGATFDHQGDWAASTTFTEGQVVTGSNGNWYQLKVASSTGDDPVGSVTGDWLEILAAAAIPDGSLVEAKFADGAVSARAISDDPLEWAAIAEKLRILGKTDVTLYVDPVNGVDASGRGDIAAPFKTPQGAWDLGVPFGGTARYTINMLNGTYAESYRAAIAMDRPALIYCDTLKLGRRTDAPGGVMTGSVVFKGESEAGVIFNPGSASGYTRAIYATAHVGSVGFQYLTVEALAGAESGIVAHRGDYVHISNITIDGNSLMTFGIIGEAGGWLEGLDVEIHRVAIGIQCYGGSFVQLSQSSLIHDCSSFGINVPIGGHVGLTTGSASASPSLLAAGGKLDLTGTSGSRVTHSGTLQMRGGDAITTFADLTGAITTYPGSRVNGSAMGWSKQWTDYGGELYLPGCKSYVAPATQSDVATPLIFLGGVKHLYVDSAFQIIDNTGAEVSESIGFGAVAIASDAVAISGAIIRGNINVANLTTTAARINVTLPSSMSGRSAGAPIPPGTILDVVNNSGFGITLAPGSIADFANGATYQIGTGSGMYVGVHAVMGTTGKWLVTPLGDLRP